MSTKDELRTEILMLDPEVELDEDLNHVDLVAKLAEMKDDPKAGAEDAARVKEEAEVEKAEKAERVEASKPPYYVAPGKAITTNRGILAGKPKDEPGEETEIKKEDLPEEGTSLKKFIGLGYIIKG